MDLPELPSHRHIPGRTARHPDGAFDAIRSRALRPTSSTTALLNPAWVYGLRLLEAGFWWETHEVLETVWLNALPNSPERQMVQGVIQLANATLKLEMARPNAARRLCDMAEGFVLASGRDPVMGLDVEDVLQAVRSLREGVSGQPPDGTILYRYEI